MNTFYSTYGALSDINSKIPTYGAFFEKTVSMKRPISWTPTVLLFGSKIRQTELRHTFDFFHVFRNKAHFRINDLLNLNYFLNIENEFDRDIRTSLKKQFRDVTGSISESRMESAL